MPETKFSKSLKQFDRTLNNTFRAANCLSNIVENKELDTISQLGQDANNIRTIAVTLAFLKIALESIGQKQFEDNPLFRHAANTSANETGFDIYGKLTEEIHLCAEIKCNVPCNKDAFAGNQKNQIKKDIQSLRTGKKSHPTEGYHKFFVMLKATATIEDSLRAFLEHKKKKTSSLEDKEKVTSSCEFIHSPKELEEIFSQDPKENVVHVYLVSPSDMYDEIKRNLNETRSEEDTK